MSYHKSLQGVGWVSIVPGGTYPDPVHVAEIESMDFNVTEDDADLEDGNGDVIDSFTTKRVIEGSISLKDYSASLLATLTRGVTVSANRPIGYTHATTIPTTPFQVTVPLTNPTRTFGTDLGVIDLTAGKAMTCDSAAATGVYSLNTGTGVYTFDTSDSGHSILIMYRATPQTADGKTAEIATSSGTASYYGLHCYNSVAAKPWGIYIPAAKLSGPQLKLSKKGWSDATIKWKATKDSSGKLAYTYTAE